MGIGCSYETKCAEKYPCDICGDTITEENCSITYPGKWLNEANCARDYPPPTCNEASLSTCGPGGFCPDASSCSEYCWNKNDLATTGGKYWLTTYAQSVVDNPSYSDYPRFKDIYSSGNQWYIKGKPTCVGSGSGGDACDTSKLVCAGGTIYGSGAGQMNNVLAAYQNPSDNYKHSSCPL